MTSYDVNFMPRLIMKFSTHIELSFFPSITNMLEKKKKKEFYDCNIGCLPRAHFLHKIICKFRKCEY